MKILLVALISLVASLIHFEKILASLLLILIIFLLIKNKKDLRIKEISMYILIFLIFFIKTGYEVKNHYSKLENTSNKEVILNLTQPINVNGNYLKTRAELNGEEVEVDYIINSKEEKDFFKEKFYGGRLKAEVRIEDIEDNKNYYAFDYKNYLNKKGIYKKVRIDKIIEYSDKVVGFKENISLIRNRALQNIENKIKFNEAGYFEALIFGEKSNLDIEERKLYTNLGLSHLLAISGLHIASLVYIFYFIFSKLGFDQGKIEKIIFLFLPIYAIFAGLSPSVIRASFMVILFILFKKVKLVGLDALLLTFMLLLLYNSYYIFDIGFQFSFFITFSLLMSSEYISKSTSPLIKSLKISTISSFASLPISIYHFYVFSPISIISNLVFVPLFTFVIFPLVVVSYFIYLITPWIFDNIFRHILNISFYINEKLLGIFSFVDIKLKFGRIEILIAYMTLCMVLLSLIFLNKHKKILSTLLIITITLYSFIPTSRESSIEQITLSGKNIFVLRGNNTLALINTSNNQYEFYDDFRKREIKYDIINQYENLLDYEGKRKFDYLVLTKTKDRDVGYAINLVGKSMVNKLVILDSIKEDERIKEIIEVARLKNIDVSLLKENMNYNLENFKIESIEKKLHIIFEGKNYELD